MCLPGAFGSSFGDVCEEKKEGEGGGIMEILKNVEFEAPKATTLILVTFRGMAHSLVYSHVSV